MKRPLALEEKLSLLWIVIMVNMIFNDIYSIVIEIAEGGVLELPGEATTIMAVAAFLTNIPTFMILLARVLPKKANRPANIGAAIFTIVYVVGGGSLLPHYIIVGAIETILCVVIVVLAWRWREPGVAN